MTKHIVATFSIVARNLQNLFARAGYYQGPVNGAYDAETHAALAQYGASRTWRTWRSG